MAGNKNIKMIRQNFKDRDLLLSKKFIGILAEEMTTSPLMALAGDANVRVDAGQIYFTKAGAGEDLENVHNKVEFNDVDNIYSEGTVPFVINAATKEMRFSPEEWIQTYVKSGMDEQAFRVKAIKMKKTLSRIVLGLWFSKTIKYQGMDLELGDGAIPVKKFAFKTVPLVNTRKEVAEEFDGWVKEFAKAINAIKMIGLKDPETGLNATDPYRTGVTVNNSTHKCFTSQDFKLRYEIWSAYFNYTNSDLEEGSYGKVLGFSLIEDQMLPFKGADIDEKWTAQKSYDQDKVKLEYKEGSMNVDFLCVKKENLFYGVVFNYMWNEAIPKTNGARVAGWNISFGAGTKFNDEMFAFDITTETPTPPEEGGEYNMKKVNIPKAKSTK